MDELQLLTGSIADLNWFKENSASIGEKYEGEFIAIDNKKILESAPKIDILIRKLEKKGININLVLIKYVNPQGEIIIL
jgi:hypothetical protein